MKKLMFGAGVLVMVSVTLGYDELPDYKDHPCIRECQVDGAPMTCEYNFTVEFYHTLSKACYNCPYNYSDCYRPHCVPTDGMDRPILTVNRMMPGPQIIVCQHDMIVVNVHNKMEGSEGTSIHWHGVFQKGYQYYDGASMITQCPITPETTFQYRFKASNRGTHYWHGHTAMHRKDGLFGPLIVREPVTLDPSSHLYMHDLPEHVMLVQDWTHLLSIGDFMGTYHKQRDSSKTTTILINGRGAFQDFTDPETNNTIHTPYAVYHVKQNDTYRFRIISNGVITCPIQISVDHHDLIVIASDGVPFEPVVVSSFFIYAGERFDFIVQADKDIGNYWLKARGIGSCERRKAKQVAILRYETAPEVEPTGPTDYESCNREGKFINPLNDPGSVEKMPVTWLNATPADSISHLKQVPDKQFYMAMDHIYIDNYRFNHPDLYSLESVPSSQRRPIPQLDHISNKIAPSPLLYQYADIPKELFCEHLAHKNCSEEYCECIHLLKVDLHDTVEIVMVHEGIRFGSNHPFHLHGYNFRVVAMDRVNTSTTVAEIKQMDKDGLIHRKLDTPIVKDTVTVPDGGYTIIRFYADNPGFWFFHCHESAHLILGLSVTIQVGEIKDMPRPPKNFPRCGNWRYTGEEEEEQPPKPCPTNHSAHLSAGGVTIVSLLSLLVLAISLLI